MLSEQGAREGEASERASGKSTEREDECGGASRLPADVPVPSRCQPEPPSAHPHTQALCLTNQCRLPPRPLLYPALLFSFSALQTSPACLRESLHCEPTMSEGSVRSGRGRGYSDEAF